MRRVLAVSAIALIGALAVPALAQPKVPVPVGVWTTQDGRVCFGVSEEVPTCTPYMG